ncbi:MAG TPA: lantibiotic dehydratase [Polyangiaceae bacterium]
MIPAGFVKVRSPLLPFEELARLGEGCQTPGRAGEAAVSAECDRIARALISAFQRPVLQDALHVASHSLSDRIRKIAAGQGTDPSVAPRLMSYFARLCTRSTPFGLFSGISVGSVGVATTWVIASPSDYRRHTRVDHEILFDLSARLEADEELRGRMRYWPNPTLAHVADRVRVVHRRGNNCVAVAVDRSRELDLVLTRAAKGATLAELASVLRDDGCDANDAAAFVADLRTSQFLVCELVPSTTGGEALATLMQTLEARGAAGALGLLTDVADKIAAIDRHGLGVPLERYEELEGALSQMRSGQAERKTMLQVELLKPSPRLSLSAAVAAEIAKAGELWTRFSVPPDALEDFRRRFVQRFDRREVPLPLALDEDVGVSLGAVPSTMSPLLAEVPFVPRAARRDAPENNPLHAVLSRKLHDAIRRGATTIALDAADVASLHPPSLPPSFAVMGSLLAGSSEALQTGDYKIHVQMVWGPSAAKLLGRFCHASPELAAAVEKLVREEQDACGEALLAEVAHLPAPRVANVTARPHMRAYGIRYFDGPTTEAACQLPIDDVLVSVVDDEVVMRSQRLGRRILPRLTHAHVAEQESNVPIYRFLRLVEAQGLVARSFSWGSLVDMPFLPRVEHGRVVLSYARWRIPSPELGPHDAPLHERLGRVHRVREELGLPRFVVLVERGADSLVIDLDNPLSAQALLEAARKSAHLDVYEHAATPGHLCLSDGERAYAHEFVVPFHRERRGAPTPREPLPPSPVETSRRSLLPGDPEWSYFRVYTGIGTSDRVLLELHDRVVSPLLEGGIVSAWFFIRYADPDDHLRLRLRLRRPEHAALVLERMRSVSADLLDRGVVWRLDAGTYEREMERYGGAACIPIVEEMFFADSSAVVAVLRRFAGDDLAEVRWMAALGVAGTYVRAAALEGETRVAFATTLAENLGREYRASVELKRKLGSLYRERAPTLGVLLSDAPWNADGRLAACAPIFRSLGESLAGHFARAAAVAPRGAVPKMLASLIHMHVNRMLRAEGIKHEIVFYDVMRRVYASALHGHAPRRVQEE